MDVNDLLELIWVVQRETSMASTLLISSWLLCFSLCRERREESRPSLHCCSGGTVWQGSAHLILLPPYLRGLRPDTFLI